MVNLRRKAAFRWWLQKGFWYWFFLSVFLIFIRISKGALLLDAFSFASRPFWPGSAQREWIENAIDLEQKIRLDLLEKDNDRLRNLLNLKRDSKNNFVSAAVISRRSRDFWQQLQINKGSFSGITVGDAVLGPGGLLGLIDSVTPSTSRVRLLTAPGAKLGVWIEDEKVHAVLIGIGTNRPQLNFLDKIPNAKVGHVVSTSPASTLLPANIPVGVVQFIDYEHLPSPYGFVQLIAAPEAIDWVQIRKLQ